MSRSRKKEPVYKDPSNTMGKKFANRALRRHVKIGIAKDEDVLPLTDEILNVYNFVDFKIRVKDKEEAKKIKRK